MNRVLPRDIFVGESESNTSGQVYGGEGNFTRSHCHNEQLDSVISGLELLASGFPDTAKVLLRTCTRTQEIYSVTPDDMCLLLNLRMWPPNCVRSRVLRHLRFAEQVDDGGNCTTIVEFVRDRDRM